MKKTKERLVTTEQGVTAVIKLSDEIIDLIRKNLKLRKEIGEILGCEPRTVYNHAARNTKSLQNYFVIKFLMKYSKKKEVEIFK